MCRRALNRSDSHVLIVLNGLVPRSRNVLHILVSCHNVCTIYSSTDPKASNQHAFRQYIPEHKSAWLDTGHQLVRFGRF